MATHTISKIELPNGDICNIDPAGNGIEETVTITVSDWTGNGPYTYEVTINGITASSVLECYFDDTINYLIDDVTVTPTSNKVTFSTASKPTNTVNATIKAAVTVTGGLPIVTSSDNGKSLVVANGVWSKSSYDGLTTNDVVNNLTSTATDKALSAAQGKALNDKIKRDIIVPTSNPNATITYNQSHYITDKIVHILCRVRVDSVPSTTDFGAIVLPNGINFFYDGLVFPVFKASGEWSAPNQICYCYQYTNALLLHSSDVTAGCYITVDFISRIQ